MEKVKVIATVINDIEYDQRMIRICNSLVRASYDVKIIGRKRFNTPNSKQIFAQHRIKMLINKGFFFYLFYNVRLFFKLLFEKFDIIHSVDLDTLLAGFLVSKLRGKELVYDSHEWFTEVPELRHNPLKRRIWLGLERFLVPRLKHAITVGDEIATKYSELYGVEFKVIRNCPLLLVDIATTEPNENTDFILYQGALNEGRGLELLIEAAPELELDVVIAGTGDLDEELKQLCKECGAESKVKFLGQLTPEQLKLISRKAKIGYNVSENLGGSYYYSLNNKYFDYIHAELPAITNAFPEYMKLNQEFECCLFINYSREELISTVKLLQDDDELYGKLKKNCFLAKQKLNWEVEEKKLLELYAEIG